MEWVPRKKRLNGRTRVIGTFFIATRLHTGTPYHVMQNGGNEMNGFCWYGFVPSES
jgi:hypothetical protein